MKTQTPRSALIARGLGLLLMALVLFASGRAKAVGSWTGVINPPGSQGIQMTMLLSDGTVMAQDYATQINWYRLTPNGQGSYANGSWAALAPMHYSRQFYGSAVLRDGRVFIAGDENDGNGGTAEIYDPVANSWTVLPTAGVGFADCDSVTLPDGRVLVSPVGWDPHPAFICTIYDPTANSWSFPGSSLAYQNECSWVKMPDGSILTIDDNARTSERFIPSLNQWINDAIVPVDTFSNGETGAGLLLPDGRAFFLGGTGHTVLYTPSSLGGTNEGSWAQGPDIPAGRVTSDAPAAMMPNGKILCAVGPYSQDGGSPAPTWFYEYDYTDHTAGPNGTFTATSCPGNSTIGSSINVSANNFVLLDLPNGNILCSTFGGQLYVYTPDSSPVASGKPTISSVSWNTGGSLHLTGNLFNGISEGGAFGDEQQAHSDYPIVRFTDGSGNVYYGRTYNWSSTGVQTGGQIMTTECTVPAAVFDFPGTFSIQVVANGIASDPVSFFGPVWVDFSYSGFPFQLGWYSYPFNSLAGGVGSVASGGTIIIKSGISHETMTISKPMTITSVYGPSTIGH